MVCVTYCRDKTWAKVMVQASGTSAEISLGTEKYAYDRID